MLHKWQVVQSIAPRVATMTKRSTLQEKASLIRNLLSKEFTAIFGDDFATPPHVSDGLLNQRCRQAQCRLSQALLEITQGLFVAFTEGPLL